MERHPGREGLPSSPKALHVRHLFIICARKCILGKSVFRMCLYSFSIPSFVPFRASSPSSLHLIRKIHTYMTAPSIIGLPAAEGNVSAKWILCVSKIEALSWSGRRSTSAKRMGKSEENPLWATRTVDTTTVIHH